MIKFIFTLKYNTGNYRSNNKQEHLLALIKYIFIESKQENVNIEFFNPKKRFNLFLKKDVVKSLFFRQLNKQK